MTSLFDARRPSSSRRGQRLAALTAVTLVMLSWSLLGRMAEDARAIAGPSQSVAWVFGSAPDPAQPAY